MKDYTKSLPDHTSRYIGEQDLYLEIFEGDEIQGRSNHRPLSYSFTVPTQAAGCGANTSLISFNRAGLVM